MHPIPTKYYYVGVQELFHCQIKIKIPKSFSSELLESCFELLSDIDRKYNSYQGGSYFDSINKNAGHFVEVDGETVWMIEHLKAVSKAVKGNYDISIMPLLRLWGFYDEDTPQIPMRRQLEEVLKSVDYSLIEVKGCSVKIAEGQELITGSFIKAYAVDRLVNYLRERAVDDAIINAGGSTIYGINSADNPEWTINIPHPLKENDFLRIEPLSNACFSLSGQVHNYLFINERRYSHILSAASGMPSRNLQVGLFTDSAFWGDAFSTALMASPVEEILAFAASLKALHPFRGYLIDESLQSYSL